MIPHLFLLIRYLERLREVLRGNTDKELKIVVESFGFKYGIPLDADYVFDVRFLPNPHWDPELRPMTGLDEPVAQFLLAHDEVNNFIYQTHNYIETWLPMLEQIIEAISPLPLVVRVVNIVLFISLNKLVNISKLKGRM